MPDATFRALLLHEENKQVRAAIEELERDRLPEGDVLVQVAYSSLNYKDGLALTGQGRIVRKYPMVPGLDLSGTVVESSSSRFQPGDPVVMTGCGSSETFWGGYTQMSRLPAGCFVRIPPGISLKQAMGVGTAGFTAMQCVMALEAHGLAPGEKEVVVTGAAGGVGSVAVAILSKLGYRVAASTGRPEQHDFLRSLGAARIVERSALAAQGKPMESEQWAGAVDAVGGDVLAGVIRFLARGTSVAACGLAGGGHLNTTVYPFILRGVNLLGINSVEVAVAEREAIWARLARDLPLDKLDSLIQVAPLGESPALAKEILAGRVRGRLVIDVNR
ncbi:MAG: oxidoreductase [Acidobacteria bacterium]|nr:oxidoreductase [Acidobacteriota bacterium]